MYHLYRYSLLSLQRSLPLSVRSLSVNPDLSPAEKTCLLCKHLNVNLRLQIRTQSSLTHPNIRKTRSRGKRKKKITDVLVVTDTFSGLQTANIIKFTPKELNLLAKTNFSLNELHKIKHPLPGKFSHTYSNLDNEGFEIAPKDFNEIRINNKITELVQPTIESRLNESSPVSHTPEYVDNFQEKIKISRSDKSTDKLSTLFESPKLALSKLSNFEENAESLQIDDFESEDVAPSEMEEKIAEPVVGIKPEPSAKRKNQLTYMQQQHRDEIAAKTLAAYLQVCYILNKPHRALATLHYHQVRSSKSRNQNTAMKDIRVYATLLKAFAHRGDYKRITDILDTMKQENVIPDLHCYVAIFECLGRINVHKHYLKDIRIFTKEAYNQGITYDDMMSNGIFLFNQRETVLSAFQAFNPKYQPNYKKPEVQYKNHLLNHLNNEEQLKFEGPEWKPNNGLFTPDVMESRINRQLKTELEGYIKIASIEKKGKITKDIVQSRECLEQHYKAWRESAEKGFRRDLIGLVAQKGPLNIDLHVNSIPVQDIIDIIVEEAKRIAHGSETYSGEVAMLYKLLGARVYSRYLIRMKQKTGVLDKILKVHSKYCHSYACLHPELDTLPTTEQLVNHRTQWQSLEYGFCSSGASLTTGHQPWVPGTLTAIGQFLYHIIIHDLKVDVNALRPNNKNKIYLPAFYTIFRSQGRLVKEEIKPHPLLSKLYKMSQSETLTFPSDELPMVCPPLPWKAADFGGYLLAASDVVRLPPNAVLQRNRMADIDRVQLYPSLDALNQLGSVPWKVNGKVLDIILEVFNKGGSAKLDVPEVSSSLEPPPPPNPNMSKEEKVENFKLRMQYKRSKAEMYSLRCDCLYRLSLANHFRNDIFWLPHNMDFRGRVYPVPPHLSHLGSDLARSMLIFGEGRPLGPGGLDWLKIHLINLTGLKKKDSIKERLLFANENMDLILDSADHPLDGKMWWAESDEPWQTLACCIEIADVVRSGINSELYKSHFPVHQDGSCNGLQHYAALGRDSGGAYSVNLVPCDLPQDVYSAVVALVEDQRKKDERDGVQIAASLNGFIKRKVIKQTIMTTVYGVTRYGARLQIVKQLKDIEDFPQDLVWNAASYLTSRTFESLRTMFTSTRAIQDWFTECARLISGVVGQPVEWVTPLGLPIVQPYVRQKKVTSSTYETFSMDQYEKPNTPKQKNAFPPNFIHSLDSCHMMMTSLHCERVGLTFVSVHDCYWTHPSTISIMNKICREQFVALHSEPILENLAVYLYNKYSYDDSEIVADKTAFGQSKKRLNNVLKQVPETGNFDLKQVLNSIYFFS